MCIEMNENTLPNWIVARNAYIVSTAWKVNSNLIPLPCSQLSSHSSSNYEFPGSIWTIRRYVRWYCHLQTNEPKTEFSSAPGIEVMVHVHQERQRHREEPILNRQSNHVTGLYHCCKVNIILFAHPILFCTRWCLINLS